MIRTQIQLPDEVFARAKKLCEAREISLAELARRGIEYILSVYAPDPVPQDEWQLPKPRNLGWKGLSHEQIKAEAQITTAELGHSNKSRKR
ncbi:MAG: antitoxin [Prosthecobacter sp.]